MGEGEREENDRCIQRHKSRQGNTEVGGKRGVEERERRENEKERKKEGCIHRNESWQGITGIGGKGG